MIRHSNRPATKQEITAIYPRPLELEEENINNGTLRYLEHWIAFSANGDLGVQHYHKNSHRIREGKPPLKNVVDHSSFTPCGYQFGAQKNLSAEFQLLDSYSSISTIYSFVPEQLQTSKSQRTSQAVPCVYPAAEPLQLG